MPAHRCDGADRERDRAIDFCLTFLKIANIIAFERVANQRKSSFVTRFFVHLLSHIMKIYHAVKSV